MQCQTIWPDHNFQWGIIQKLLHVGASLIFYITDTFTAPHFKIVYLYFIQWSLVNSRGTSQIVLFNQELY